MTDDTISRAAAIEALKRTEALSRAFGYHAVIDAIEALPSAQPGWIPWNNGELPEESGTYAVTVHDGTTKRVTYAKYQKRLKRWELTGSRAYWKVLAWQPMPKPWEGR